MLKDELHAIDVDPTTGKELLIKIRPVGDLPVKSLETCTWKEGALKVLLFFSLFTEVGSLAETLFPDGRVLSA